MAEQIKPYYTSNDLIEAIKRSISFPVAQNTFSSDDLLRFATEEMLIEQVPAVLSYHEEYYVYTQTVALEANQSRYTIPSRAVGMRLRDILYLDVNGDLVEMTRVNSTDKTHFQRTNSTQNSITKYYIENDEIVLIPEVGPSPIGSLVFYYFIRPNALVDNSRAAIVSSIDHAVTTHTKSCPNSSVNDGTGVFTISNHGFIDDWAVTLSTTDTLPGLLQTDTPYFIVNATANTFELATIPGGTTITFGTPGVGIHTITRYMSYEVEFSPSDINLTNNSIDKINWYVDGTKVMLSSTGNLPTEFTDNRIYYVVNAGYSSFKLSLTSGGSAISLQSIGTGTHTATADLTVLTSDDAIPSNITNGSIIDFLQTEGSHKILAIDKYVPDNGISGSTITVRTADLPDSFVVGDYVCLARECIVPFLPSDLHYGLAERTCSRILASINDKEGLAVSQSKIQSIERAESRLLDNRVEGSPEKVLNRQSLLRYGRSTTRRRF